MSSHLPTFIATLKKKIPEATWPWVFSALQHDATVWEGLSAGLGQPALERSLGIPIDFSPAGLALACLQEDLNWVSLLAEEMQPLDLPDGGAENTPPAFPSIVQAAQAAANLRERRRLLGTWEGLHPELTACSPTALAVLYGLVPDPLDMLHALLASSRWNYSIGIDTHLALHALLSNPQPPELRDQSLSELVRSLPFEVGLELVNQLNNTDTALAELLAQELLARQGSQFRDSPADKDNMLAKIEALQGDAKIHQIAGQSGQALLLLNNSIQAVQQLEAELTAQTAQIYLTQADTQAALLAWERACELDPASANHNANLALALLDASRTADAQAYLSNVNGRATHPLINLAQARLALERNNLDDARQYALKSLTQMFKKSRGGETSTHPAATSSAILAELLLRLGMPDKAVQAAELAVEYHPDQPDSHALLARALCTSGDIHGAVLSSHLATALAPERLDLRRDLAERLELAEDWTAALEERSALAEKQDSPAKDDLHLLCACAINANKPERCEAICQQIIAQNSEDGLAYAYLGAARAMQGDPQQALEHLHRAIQLTPSQVTPWLHMAHFYQSSGQNQKAIDSLRSATYAAPGHPEIHLTLSKLYLEQGSPTQALNDLRLAAELCSSTSDYLESSTLSYRQAHLRSQVALGLGQVLAQLGHPQEACQVLEDAYTLTPSNPTLAWGYAQVLLSQGELSRSLQPLETVLHAEPAEIDPYLSYARCLLQMHDQGECDVSLERAIPPLEQVLESHPKHPEANALLGEAYCITGQPELALQAFNVALTSDLVKDPVWQVRLSLGLGQTALALGQVETAVAALQEANQTDPLSPHVQRSLSDAYRAAGLPADAFHTAQAALLLAPDDVETLIWFADQVMSLQSQPGVNILQAKDEAINALNRAAQLSSTRGDLIVRLGQAQLMLGELEAALQTLSQLADAEETGLCMNGSTNDYYLAAKGLLQLGDAKAAVVCLEHGLQIGGSAGYQSGPRLLDLLTELCVARAQAGDTQGALEAIDQAITIAPNEPSLYLVKANLLFDMQRLRSSKNPDEAEDSEALLCLEMALKLSPGDPALHHRVAQIYRAAGNIRAAAAHAQRMVEVCTENSPWLASAHNLAAELATARLDFDRARALVDIQIPHFPEQSSQTPDGMFEFRCLRAELALEAGEHYLAVNELAILTELSAGSPRLLALQARMAYRRNDDQIALDYLNAALQASSNTNTISSADLRALADAALELHQWDKAIQLYQTYAETSPYEPLAHLSLARGLAIRAEHQRLSQAMEVIRRAPGEHALTSLARQTFGKAIDEADALYNRLAGEGASDSSAVVSHWLARGLASFEPTIQNDQALARLPADPEVVAARLACLSLSGDLAKAGYIARDYPNNPLILLLLALTLAGQKPRQAMAAAHAAADALAETQLYHLFRSGYRIKDLTPLVQALLARLYRQAGIRSSDRPGALMAIHNALASWPDEPRWHFMAAELSLEAVEPEEQPDIESAIAHLEQAIHWEPRFTPAHLLLGRIYLERGKYDLAQLACEQACRLEPEAGDAWLMLAQADFQLGQLDQAATHAENAASLLPDRATPLALLGEIALKSDNPKNAQSRAMAALEIDAVDEDALLLLAHSLEAMDRIPEALEVLNQAVDLASHPLPLMLERVRLLSRGQSVQAASQAIQELNAQYPEQPQVLAFMAALLAEAGQRDEAIRVAQRALRANSETGTLKTPEHAEIHLLLGRLLSLAGQLDQAIYHLNEAVNIQPDLVEAYLELGQTNRERRQYAQALSAYQTAIDIAPEDYRPYYQMGITLKDSKDYLAAERVLRNAAELATDNPAVHKLLAAVIALNLVHNRREAAHEFPAQYG